MATLLPCIRYRIVDTATGAAIPGAKVYTYVAGTSTPKDSYTSSTASVANTNPVIADARGEVLIWLSGAYKIVIHDADDNLIDEEDNVVDLTSGGTFATPTFTGTVTYSGTTMTWSGNPTHSGNHTFSGNVTTGGNASITGDLTVNGNVTLGNAPADTITVNGAPTFSAQSVFNGGVEMNGAVTLGNASSDTITVTGTPAGLVSSGTYTPTLTSVSNVQSSTSGICHYLRIGDHVNVSGRISIDPTSATTGTNLGISLPVASDFAASSNGSGISMREIPGISGDPLPGYVYADVTNNRAELVFMNDADVASRTHYFTFTYQVI
jgi:hypothetical protein